MVKFINGKGAMKGGLERRGALKSVHLRYVSDVTAFVTSIRRRRRVSCSNGLGIGLHDPAAALFAVMLGDVFHSEFPSRGSNAELTGLRGFSRRPVERKVMFHLRTTTGEKHWHEK